ncbi:MAG: glycosyl transferase group 1 [Aeromicrobium sp.]|nr:glycosyl transferase group 1 [Aeromicrobium sp.]
MNAESPATSVGSAPTVAFPPGTYYAVTWGIESRHGGMTSAYLHRSRAFVREAGVPVTIITYEHQEDLDETIADLRRRELVIDGMSFLNLWNDLRTWDDATLRSRLATSLAKPVEHFRPLNGAGTERTALREQLVRPDGEIEQVDYYRADGSLMVSNRKFVHGDKGVAVTFCDRESQPIATFSGIRVAYRFWLDYLPRDPMAYMIIDSKTSANHYPELRRDDIVTLYMVHGSHLADGQHPPHGRLSPGRTHTFRHLRDFDGVVMLTERQRQDVQDGLGPLDNLYVCPNSREVTGGTSPAVTRDEKQGIALGALVAGKRFDHAVEAVSRARKHRAFVKLNIYGRGGQERKIRKVIRSHRLLGRQVKLAGYTTTPEEEMARSSFILMTSNREGLGLVLIEAMSKGCVPIAYDIDYGPGDIITDGVNGFLVERGSMEAMGRAIAKFVKLPAARRQAMRDAAIERSRDFDDLTVVRRWADIFEDARKRKTEAASAE